MTIPRIGTTPTATVKNSDGVSKTNTPTDGLSRVTVTFSPSEIPNLKRDGKGNLPKTVVVSENVFERRLIKQSSGLDPNSPADSAILRQRMGVKSGDVRDSISWNGKSNGKSSVTLQLNTRGQYEAVVGVRNSTLSQLKNQPINNVAPTGTNANEQTAVRAGTDTRTQQAELQKRAEAADQTKGLSEEEQKLILDLGQVGLDIAGIVDPTGIADAANALVSLGRGNFGDALISAAGIIPFGDIAKIGKLKKLVDIIGNAVNVAKNSQKFAKAIEPILKGIKTALDKVPLNKLPDFIREPLEKMKSKIDDFFGTAAKRVEVTKPSLPPNPNRVPEGNPKKPSPRDNADRVRSLQRENESAQVLSEQGFKVKQLSEGKVQGQPYPDFDIEGRIFDNYAPNANTSLDRIRSTFRDKIKAGQAERFVLNLNDSTISISDLKKHLQNFPLEKLQEIIIIKDRKAVPFYPF